MTTKAIDAVEMKRHGAKKINDQMAQMTTAQQFAFWQQRTLELQARQQACKDEQIKTAPSR